MLPGPEQTEKLIQTALKHGGLYFWAHIIMHMRNMRIIAIIMLLTMLK